MISLTVKTRIVTKGIQVLTKPRPHIHLGRYNCDLSDHVGIDLDPYNFDAATVRIERVSLQPKKRGREELHLVKERRDDGECALVLIDVPPGIAGSTLWTAATQGVIDCSYRGKWEGGSPCPECGVRYADRNDHPNEGSIYDWGSFEKTLVRVVAEAEGFCNGYRYSVRLITMGPNDSFRIERRGDIQKGEPRELFYAWVDGELRCGENAKGVLPMRS